MCGVTGFIGEDAARDDRISAIRRGIRGIVHRGPEEVGIYDDPDFTLGTVRLCLVDQPLGKQPMVSPDNRYVLGFNGEVFNYIELRAELEAAGVVFRTRSDTEVLLHTLSYWGLAQGVARLHGQFAFAWYDRRTKRLTLCRDPFGERPLFYAKRAGTVYFASEVKGMFAYPRVSRELAPDRVLACGQLWSPIPDESCFREVQCLPQGHWATVTPDGTVQVTKHYHGIDRPQSRATQLSFNEAKEQLKETIRDAVRIRLRGDYGLGVAVSGGVDSAIVAATVRELVDGPINSYSIRLGDSPFDEGPQQRLVIDALGLKHSQVRIRADEVRERFARIVAQCEMPLYRTAPVAVRILAEHVGASGNRMLLGGEGADEAFLGYDIAKEAVLADAWMRSGTVDADAEALNGLLKDLRFSSADPGREVIEFYRSRLRDPNMMFGAHLRRFESGLLTTLIRADCPQGGTYERMAAWVRTQVPTFDSWDVPSRSRWLDMHTLLIGYGMTCHGDRPGAGCGVETRYPFLDRRVVELGWSLPQEWLLREGVLEKHLLRDTFRDVLPPEIAARPKFAMRLPGVDALLPGRGDWVDDIVAPASVERSTVLDAAATKDFLARVTSVEGALVASSNRHAYLQVLSILLLEDAYMRNYAVPDVDIDRVLFREVDGTRLGPIAETLHTAT